jgi:hypothetical protein
MKIKISDLLLWQWRPSMVKDSGWWRYDRGDGDGMLYSWKDELLIRKYMKGFEDLPPIRIDRDYTCFQWSEKAKKQIAKGKWMVQDGFHRIYAARRLGRKEIEAVVF